MFIFNIMNALTFDILSNCNQYLTFNDLLQWSSITKKNVELPTNRSDIKSHLSAIKNEKIFRNLYEADDLKEVFKELSLDINGNLLKPYDIISILSTSILVDINYNNSEDNFYKLNKYKKQKTFTSHNFEDDGFFLYDTDMCCIFNVPKYGKIRRVIKRSLLLKALIN